MNSNRYYTRRSLPGAVILKIRGGKFEADVLIDKADYSLVARHPWCAKNNGYIETTFHGKKIKLHRLILNYTGPDEVDHINRVRSDCRRGNLRIVPHMTNMLNQSKRVDNKSGRTGIVLETDRRRKNQQTWRGQVKIQGKWFKKSFSVKKYGFYQAKALAEQFRIEMENKYEILTER